MKKNSFNVLGIMSGTSLDGLDIAYCLFRKKGKTWKYSIQAASTFNYSAKQKEGLTELMNASAEKLTEEDYAWGTFIGEKINVFLKKQKLKNPDFISSHGHTVFHQPEKGFTLQIGNGAAIHGKTGIPVVCDFRSLDVCLGGQGAPLVPIGDKLLFQDYNFCLNLGGISNISFDVHKQRVAYDISPVNIVLNALASEKGFDFDKGGKLGKSGTIDTELLMKLNALDYYSKKFPKSIGKEWVDKEVFPLIHAASLSVEDKLATFYEHTTYQIAQEVKKQIHSKRKGKAILLCTGGGALNTFLIQKLSEKLSGHAKVEVPAKNIVLFKEALIFAFLGVLRVRNEMNCLSSVTGAKRDNIGGALYGKNI